MSRYPQGGNVDAESRQCGAEGQGRIRTSLGRDRHPGTPQQRLCKNLGHRTGVLGRPADGPSLDVGRRPARLLAWFKSCLSTSLY